MQILTGIESDACYCSCERVFRPDPAGRLVAEVLSNNDGCVIARSSEAKRLGIAMAALWLQAWMRSPTLATSSTDPDGRGYSAQGH